LSLPRIVRRQLKSLGPFGRAIRRGARDRLGADRAARPRPVFDDHRRSPAAPGLIRHQPRDDIGGAARRVRDDNAFLVVSTPFLIDPLLRKLNYDPLHSFAPICNLEIAAA